MRFLFLRIASLRTNNNFCKAVRLVILLSIGTQLFVSLTRIKTITLHSHWLSVIGLLLNLMIILIQLASLVEISDFYHEYHRALQMYLNDYRKERWESEFRDYPKELVPSSSSINSLISGNGEKKLK